MMNQNELRIHLHAHNHANLQKTEKLHPENKTTFIWNILTFSAYRVSIVFLKYFKTLVICHSVCNKAK